MTNSQTVTTNYKKTALLLAGILLLTGVGSIIAILYPNTSAAATIAHIYQKGKLLESIPLDEITQGYTFTITGVGGSSNTIEVRPATTSPTHPGSIGIISASCPDKLCVHQGFISNSKLPITCLPNGLVIQIENSNATKLQTDTITY